MFEERECLAIGVLGARQERLPPRLDRLAAIKVLAPAMAGDPDRRGRMEREAKAVSALNHPHISPRV